MSGIGGRRLVVVAAVAGVLITGGGVAYALTPTTAGRAVAQEAPDGTQPLSDAEVSASPSDSIVGSPIVGSPIVGSPSVGPTAPSPTASVVPSASAPTQPKVNSVAEPAGCPTGTKHRETEGYLAQIGTYGAVTVDGQQSVDDCAAIKKFQTRFGISPANGQAGPTTADVARRIAGSLTEAERGKCGAGAEATACVDLTLQTMWVVKDGVVAFGPTVIRTGMKGYATPGGTYSVFNRSPKAWSTPYKVWLPYWQNFVRGIGFHATTTYIHSGSIGSHGCVNLLYGDAKTLYSTIGMGSTVKVFGRRPGT